MGIVQQASGTYTGTSCVATLPGASSAANCVVVCLAGNVTATTPTNWTLRTSQVNIMGHYWWDRTAVSVTSVTITTPSGQGVWYIAEIAGGTYQNALSAQDPTVATTYTTPSLVPTAGTRELIASLGSVANGGGAATVSTDGWTNSFVEVADNFLAAGPSATQADATRDNVVADGVASYSTTGTFTSPATTREGRTAIIASYVTTVGAAAAPIPDLTMAPFRR